MVEIKDISGKTRFSTEIGEGSKRKFTLQKEDYITLRFSLTTPIHFKLGDRVDDTRFGLFELCDIQKPGYNESTGGYDYELRFDAHYWKWKNKIFKFTPEAGGQEASWNLTASLDVHLDVFLRNLDVLGYTYSETNFEYSIDHTVENSAKLISYENTNLLDALTRMSEAWDCEWWITDNIIHFGRCEHGDPVDFELGKNVEFMTRSDSSTSFATRIYAFGSTRNLPTNYRPIDESVLVNGITQKRLMLPVATPYIDAYPNLHTVEAIEDVVVFDDVYPRRIGSVSDVVTHEYKEIIKEEGKPDVINKWNAYRFKDSGVTFSDNYRLEGQDLKIVFQSGSLNGMEFTVIFNPCDKESGETPIPEKNPDGSWNPLAQVWEIVRNEDYGRPLPDDVMFPRGERMEGNKKVPADTYTLSGFDTKFVSETMIPDAEQELKEKTEKYVAKSKIDPSTYDCTLTFNSVKNLDGGLRLFELGDRVNLINAAYFETGNRISRIIGFEYKLDKPEDLPVYTIGETASYSRIGDLESKIDALTFKGQTYTGGGGSGVYVVRTNDSTPASNSNVFSALRSLASFIRKDVADTVTGLITFLNGLRIVDGSYRVKAALTGGGYPLFVGGETAEEASFSVSETGVVKAMEGVFGGALSGVKGDFRELLCQPGAGTAGAMSLYMGNATMSDMMNGVDRWTKVKSGNLSTVTSLFYFVQGTEQEKTNSYNLLTVNNTAAGAVDVNVVLTTKWSVNGIAEGSDINARPQYYEDTTIVETTELVRLRADGSEERTPLAVERKIGSSVFSGVIKSSASSTGFNNTTYSLYVPTVQVMVRKGERLYVRATFKSVYSSNYSSGKQIRTRISYTSAGDYPAVDVKTVGSMFAFTPQGMLMKQSATDFLQILGHTSDNGTEAYTLKTNNPLQLDAPVVSNRQRVFYLADYDVYPSDPLWTKESFIVYTGSTAATIRLPDNPMDGAMYRFYSRTANMTFISGGIQIYRTGDAGSFVLARNYMMTIFLVNEGGLKRWIIPMV